MKLPLLIIIISSLLLGGCAGAPIMLNYAPSSTKSVEGALKVGDFEYLPAKNNSELKPNQIRNTALGEILLEKNIDEYFKTALFTESRFVGIKVNKSKNVVSGQIKEFLIDDLGYSIDWTLEVNFVVNNGGSAGTCYNKTHKIEKNTAKFANAFGTLNEVMKLNIEEAFNDKDFVRCISNKA